MIYQLSMLTQPVTSQDRLSGAALTNESQVPWLKTRGIYDILSPPWSPDQYLEQGEPYLLFKLLPRSDKSDCSSPQIEQH